MQKFSFTFTPKNLILVNSETGKRYSISTSHFNFSKIKEALSSENWEEIENLLDLEEQLSTQSKDGFRLVNNQVEVKTSDGWFVVPQRLSSVIIQYLEEKLPFDRLVKFAVNLSRNPSRKSVSQLFSFIEAHGLTITENGNFIAYKGVKSNFTDWRTSKIDNSVGQSPKMPRNEVEDDPNVACAEGLHVASYEYAHYEYGFGRDGVTILVEVNPEHVVSVPKDHKEAKIRVCEYKVLSVSPDKVQDKIYNTNVDDEDCDDEYSEEYDEDDEDDEDDYESEEGECPECGSSIDRL